MKNKILNLDWEQDVTSNIDEDGTPQSEQHDGNFWVNKSEFLTEFLSNSN